MGFTAVMRSFMPVFGKKENCPSSVELLAFSHSAADPRRIPELRRHLTFCDFCAAELELYIHFPPDDEAAEAGPIPKHLFDLAESILKRKQIVIGYDIRKSESR